MIDGAKIRQDFPILHQKINGKPLVYLDNAATSQKPKVVIDALQEYYCEYNANIHRGLYYLSAKATEAYELARTKIAAFIGAKDQEVIFTSGTTAAINLVAHSWGNKYLKSTDTILLTEMEHHSNIVPWHLLKDRLGINLRFIPVEPDGTLNLENLETLLDGVKLVSLTHASNTLGTINPIKAIIAKAHQAGAKVLIDGAQAAPHLPIDVKELDCDFYAFSGHKMCAPTGIGVLWAKENILNEMPPFLGGGEMIDSVSLTSSSYAEIPNKFEAGTMPIAQAIAMGKAVDYISDIGLKNIAMHEEKMVTLALEKLQQIDGLKIIGTSSSRVGAISFVMEKIHPHDIATILDYEGIAVRAGHHCTQPLMKKFKIPATTRASFYFYNYTSEIDNLVSGLQKVKEIFKNVS